MIQKIEKFFDNLGDIVARKTVDLLAKEETFQKMIEREGYENFVKEFEESMMIPFFLKISTLVVIYSTLYYIIFHSLVAFTALLPTLLIFYLVAFNNYLLKKHNQYLKKKVERNFMGNLFNF